MQHSYIVTPNNGGVMLKCLFVAFWCTSLVWYTSALAQSSADLAMNAPDQLAWQLFVELNSRAAGSSVLFETFATDDDTFQKDPQYPSGPTAPKIRRPILPTVIRQARNLPLPALPLATGEETRRNRVSFNYIVQNNLYRRSGLRAAFGRTISFPVGSIEVKANWVPVDLIPQITQNQVTAAQVPQLYHVSSSTVGTTVFTYALVSMHVISKAVPDWTWATFEHRFNPGRCDFIGCEDAFGAQQAYVPPNEDSGRIYADCRKSTAASELLAKANIDAVYANYCLKGTQVNFTDKTGLAVRLGNSVTEELVIERSSCMTCHARAAFDRNGANAAGLGLIDGVGPLGPIQPSWFWNTTSPPPIYQGLPGLTAVASSADYVWSVAFCAIDDSTDPPRPQPLCVGH